MTVESEIRALEKERGEAVERGDWAKLASLLTEDLVHTHATGRTHTKAQYLESAASFDWVSVERGDLLIREYGDTVIVTGPLIHTIRKDGEVLTIPVACTQVWVKQGTSWLQCSFHCTMLPK